MREALTVRGLWEIFDPLQWQPNAPPGGTFTLDVRIVVEAEADWWSSSDQALASVQVLEVLAVFMTFPDGLERRVWPDLGETLSWLAEQEDKLERAMEELMEAA